MRFSLNPFGNSKSPFAKALASYGFKNCSQRQGKLLIGVPAMDGLDPIDNLPEGLKAVAFLAAPVQVDLIGSFMSDPLAQKVEILAVGTSHYYAQHRLGDYDMRAAIVRLDQPLPSLRKAVLGDMSQLFNGGQYYGKLGEIGPFLEQCPALEKLDLFGQFALRAPVRHPALKTLYAAADSIGVSGGPVDQQTVTNLLLSEFASLESLELELEEEDLEEDYSLPQGFAGAGLMPKLEKLYIDPLAKEAQEALDKWRTRS
ncbi:hypothetical protein TRP8649_01961 [Pelagimonas phthalicica]|uniref:Uncharacterized protein n=1 Tax=Pelagimonas phthalicica TaxID=1037362 RepID=A0A238JAW6_9RHOB|nr:hypothetical protein [Pelagimonas phthalicica]TDS93628.1 hypothetical protein CLV87_0112 [Pelagimonas phthalicica]SMX27851.1 hypothetical protein TRP8649_01961 [Pelagimonas phthalicica]